MRFIPTEIPDVILIEPRLFGDERGFFMETYRACLFEAAGIKASFVQDNHSGSKQGTLRGLHYQIQQAQGKLLRVVSGEIFDAVVDLRKGSPTFGKWAGAVLSAHNRLQMWVPPGFAHGFYVLSEWSELCYKTTDYYAPQFERSLLWNDPAIGIEWPILEGKPLILSPKDADGCPLQKAETYEHWEAA